jgi:hypothetical protein
MPYTSSANESDGPAAGGPLPPLRRLADSLGRSTELLAGELASPSHKSPDWSDTDWHVARAVAALHGISPLLHNRLRWRGPTAWCSFLAEQAEQSVLRSNHVGNLLSTLDLEAERRGVVLFALKGAALRSRGIYAPGERPMGDIDLLVAERDLASTAGVLARCGYSLAFTMRRHLVFRPVTQGVPKQVRLGEHIDSPLKIEVHTCIAEQLPLAPQDITALIKPRDPRPGLNDYDSDVQLMMHLLLHAAGNMRARALRLIQLYDIAKLAPRLGDHGWRQLSSVRPSDRGLWWAAAPLSLAARYFAEVRSPEVDPKRFESPWLLTRAIRRQRLYDVSWSNVYVEAFPGIEWSRSWREAGAFILSRVFPGQVARAELAQAAQQIPGAASIPWYGISHAARIARWIFFRPPRVQTLLSVRAAFAGPT